MKITTKRVLAVTITVVCALALTLTIGFFPSGKGNNETISNSDNIQKQTADSKVEVPKGEDYKSMSKEELLAVIEEKDAEIDELVDKVDASFVIDDLTYLHKGGRCSGAAKLGANLLKLKPCIQVKDGAMGVGKKYRGDYKKCVAEYIKDKLADTDSIDKKRVFVTHTKCDEEVVKLAIDTVKECFEFDEILETTAGCTVTTHCGPNTLGILFFRKNNLE